MLKKLRVKFIIINMTIVTIMLCFIFMLLYISTKKNLEKESIQMMTSIAMNPMPPAPPGKPRVDIALPYFTIRVDQNGNAIETEGEFFDLSDKDLIEKILKKTSDSQSKIGILDEYNLRFSRIDTPMGQCYVFADITNEQATLNSLIKTFIITGTAAFLIFLCISALLARWAVTPVETAWKQQKQFIADASHELKTPLTVILTDAELLQAPDCSDIEQKQLQENIMTMSYQMRGLVESLLNLARLDHGTVKENMKPVSLDEIAQNEAIIFEPVFFEKDLKFNYSIDEKIIVKGNDVHLKQLLDILLDNASKYTLQGGEIKLSLHKTSAKKCLLTVSNQGNPIEEEDLKNLFKRFYRVDKARSSSHSYGLGLSIAESIVEEHQGKIWAESKDGYNSFYVDFYSLINS